MLYAYSLRFHGPFIISKPSCLCTSLTRLGKQSSRRNQQLLVRQVITNTKPPGCNCHLNTVFRKMAAKRQFKESIFGGLFGMLSLKRRLGFPTPSSGRNALQICAHLPEPCPACRVPDPRPGAEWTRCIASLPPHNALGADLTITAIFQRKLQFREVEGSA